MALRLEKAGVGSVDQRIGGVAGAGGSRHPLLDNVVQAIEGDGRITVRTGSEDREHLRIEVADMRMPGMTLRASAH